MHPCALTDSGKVSLHCTVRSLSTALSALLRPHLLRLDDLLPDCWHKGRFHLSEDGEASQKMTHISHFAQELQSRFSICNSDGKLGMCSIRGSGTKWSTCIILSDTGKARARITQHLIMLQKMQQAPGCLYRPDHGRAAQPAKPELRQAHVSLP